MWDSAWPNFNNFDTFVIQTPCRFFRPVRPNQAEAQLRPRVSCAARSNDRFTLRERTQGQSVARMAPVSQIGSFQHKRHLHFTTRT
eukprot:gene9345-12592_t